MTGFKKQILLGILLVVISTSSSSILTEALRSSRGIRGLARAQLGSHTEVVLEREELLAEIRGRQQSAKGGKGKRQAKEDKEEEEEEEDNKDDEKEDDKDDEEHKDNDDDKEDKDQEVIIEEAVEEEIFMGDEDAGPDDNTEEPAEETNTEPPQPQPRPDVNNGPEPEPNNDNEATNETTPPDDVNEPDVDGEPIEEPLADDTEEDNSTIEETMPPEDSPVTDAPTLPVSTTIPDDEIVVSTTPPEAKPETEGPESETETPEPVPEPEPEVGSFTVELSSFSVAIDNVQLIDTDPGIMIYLHTELNKYYDNLVSVDMIFDPSTVENRNRRQLIPQMLSYYDGYAIFEGPPRLDAQQVQDSQAEILSDQDAIEAVIAESLGTGSSAFTVSSIQIQEDANPNGASGSGSGTVSDEGNISVAGLVLATVAACLGAILFTLACFFYMKNPDPRNKLVERGYSLPPKDETPEKAPSEQEGILNRTMDTEDDHEHDHADDDVEELVYEEFAENIVKHDFEGDWKDSSPVQPTEPASPVQPAVSPVQPAVSASPVQPAVSVLRGTLVETASLDRPSFDEEDVAFDEEENAPSDEEDDFSNTNPEDLKRELGEQLSELQASVKAAREKTQLLLDQGRQYQSPDRSSTDR